MNWIQQYSGAISGLSAVALTVITTYYVFLTWKLLNETREAYRRSMSPELAIYLKPSEVEIAFIVLCIENVGNGPALNVQLRSNTEGSDGLISLQDVGPFKNGLRLVAPGHRIEHFLTSVIGKLEALKEHPLEIVANYEDSHGEARSTTFFLDFAELENLSRIGKSPLHEMAKTLSSLQQDFHNVASGNRLSVVTETVDDHRRRQREDVLVASFRGLSEERKAEIEALTRASS